MKFHKRILLSFFVVLLFVLMSCKAEDQKNIFQKETLSVSSIDYFNTVTNISLYGDNANQAVLDEVVERLEDIDKRMSAHEASSELGQLSNAESPQTFSADTIQLIALAEEISVASGGAFDITIAPLVSLWGIGTENAAVPSDEAIKEALSLVDYNKIRYSTETLQVELMLSGMRIDLGAIAKGYACDEAVRILRENDVETALLDLGGNVFAYGKKTDGTRWRVGLRTPIIGESDDYFAVLELEDKAVVTSGAYERYFETESGEIFHHIIDPKSGYPSQSDLLAAIIVCESSTRADALSTACFVLGYEKGRELIEKMNDVDAIFVLKDMSVYVCDNLREAFVLQDSRFKLID